MQLASALAASALLTAVGLILLFKGLFPKRQGTTPFCRKCGYNLTGIDRDGEAGVRCPECGEDVRRSKSVLIGERHRRRGMAFSGAVCAVFGLAPLVLATVAKARSIEWYQLKPTRRVMVDLRSFSRTTAERADLELGRRMRQGSLTDGQQFAWIEDVLVGSGDDGRRTPVRESSIGLVVARYRDGSLTAEHVDLVIEAGLTEQQHEAVRPLSQALIDLLDEMRRAGDMSSEQAERYFSNSFQVVTREMDKWPVPIHVGQDVRIVLRFRARVPRSITAVPHLAVTHFDGEVLHVPVTLSLRGGAHDGGRCGWSFQFPRPGRGEVTVSVQTHLYERVAGMRKVQYLGKGSSATFRRSVEVLPALEEHRVTLQASSELDAAVQSSVTIARLALSARDGDSPRRLSFETFVESDVPVGLALEVFVEFEGQSFRAGVVTVPKAHPSREFFSSRPTLPADTPDRINLVFRSSAELARRTVGLYEIWDGTLVMRDVLATPGFGAQDPQHVDKGVVIRTTDSPHTTSQPTTDLGDP